MCVHSQYGLGMDITHGRTAHLIDVENLVGNGRFGASETIACRAAYDDLGLIRSGDHVIVACNPFSAIHVKELWPGVRLLTGHGENGADRALLAAIEHEGFHHRFDRIVLGSGDGIFTVAVASLRRSVQEVLVVGRPGSIAHRLRFAAGRTVLELPLPDRPFPTTNAQSHEVA
jgi:hypothetical protein